MTRAETTWAIGAAFASLVLWQNRHTLESMMITDDEALQNQNIQAFLRAIRAGESSQGEEAYTMLVYGGTFSDFSTHPKIFKPIPGSHLKTSAAGAYQITYTTWLWLHVLAGVSDFSPRSQDLMAIAYLRKLGALSLIRDGRYAEAVELCRPVWEAITVPKLRARMDTAYINYGGMVA